MDRDKSRPQSRRTRTQRANHPAFEGSDSEDDVGISKAELFQELLLQDVMPIMEQTEPSSIPKHKHTRLIHAIEAPLKRIIRKHTQTKENFLMINDVTSNSPDVTRQSPSTDIPATITAVDTTASELYTINKSINRKRKRRYTVGEASLLYHAYPFGKDNPSIVAIIQRFRIPSGPHGISRPDSSPPWLVAAPFSLTTSSSASLPPTTSPLRNPSLIQDDGTTASLDGRARTMSMIAAPSANEWREAQDRPKAMPSSTNILDSPIQSPSNDLFSDWTKRDLLPSSPEASKSRDEDGDANSMTSSVIVKLYSEPAPGLDRFTKVSPQENIPAPATEMTILNGQPIKDPLNPLGDKRSKLKKSVPRDMQISAPAPNEESDFLDLAITTPRTPPIPPPNDRSMFSPLSQVLGPVPPSLDTNPIAPATADSRFSHGSGSSSGSAAMSPVNSSPDSPRKSLRLQVVAKAAAKLLGNRRSSSVEQPPPLPPLPPLPVFPPLLYSFTIPIEQHALAISNRVKEEFKLKLSKRYDLPGKDTATEEELLEELRDINGEIGHCAKEATRMIMKAKGQTKGRKAEGISHAVEKDMRTILNQFMVTRIFQPFSIELDPEADEVLREQYLEIAPKVPQFIAARWRVLASSSTSRPIQQLTTALAILAAEVSSLMLGELASDAKLSQELDNLLAPVIRHAYLLAHFNHLEMVSCDYDIFYGTEVGGWLAPAQEEEQISHSKKSRNEGRVNGYWSLGLRRRRFIGEGPAQRRVWDVTLKAKVYTGTMLSVD